MISGANGFVRYCVPYIVNGAFSAELSLKSILTAIEIVYQKDYNLLKLSFATAIAKTLEAHYNLDYVNKNLVSWQRKKGKHNMKNI